MRAFHFTEKKLRDGRPIPKVGEWLIHEGEIEMCRSGLHASKQPFDALQYAPGSILHLVEVQGEIKQQQDKIVGRRRKILASFDAEDLLWEYARQCALDVYHLWGNDETDPKGICKKYLETGDKKLRGAARDAAARAAARGAAGDAAWAAARGAACAAAWAAACAAAWAAACAAAGDAAGAAQRKRFNKMVRDKFKAVLEEVNA